MLKILFVFLMAGGVPVAIAMAGAALVYILISGDLPPFAVVHRMIGGIDSFPLLAVPFFILAGNLMNNAGITNRIFGLALAMVGWLKGGLGHVNIVASMIFSGMSGTAIADAAGLGTIEVKAMKEQGYSSEFAAGVTAASATLGPIIPPSLPFVIYAMLANVSVGGLFLAGILPGLLLAVLMMATVSYFAWRNHWGSDMPFSASRFGKAVIELAVVAGWPLALCGLDPGGGTAAYHRAAGSGAALRGRLEVPFPGRAADHDAGAADRWHDHRPVHTHRGAIAACMWAIVLGGFWYRTMSFKAFTKVCLETVETTATVMFIVAASSIFSWMLTATGVTADIASWILGVTREPWMFLMLANLLMLFVGCFLEPVAAITILVPILLPIATQLGIDPVHFGLVMVLNLMIGLLTPPVGLVLFIMARIANLSIERTMVALLPWFIPLVGSLIVITYVPQLVLWLPQAAGLLK
jgi:TRAP-type C4-dicarboxylate transport system permease large subunit